MYAPNLNVIELFWKCLRRKVTHNHLPTSGAALTAAVETLFTELDRQSATVLSVFAVPDNFRGKILLVRICNPPAYFGSA